MIQFFERATFFTRVCLIIIFQRAGHVLQFERNDPSDYLENKRQKKIREERQKT